MQGNSFDPQQVFGNDVVDSGGNKIGTVDNVWVDDATGQLEFVGVKTGWLMGKPHVIPAANAQIDGNRVQVPYGEDQIKNAPSFGGDDELSPENENEIYSYFGIDRSTALSPTGLPAGESSRTSGDYASSSSRGYDTADATEEREVTLSEERLNVGKRQVQAGGVRLRKVVRTEHQEVPVELRREEVNIERLSPDEVSATPDTAFQEQEIEVPVTREEAVVGKQARVTGGVRVSKDMETETQTVGGNVRREDVDVVRTGDTTLDQ